MRGRTAGTRNSVPRSDLRVVRRTSVTHPTPTSQPTPCILWQGRDNGRYGVKWDADRQQQVLVHRWVWEQVNGPTDLRVLHRCDNTVCFRYGHLRAGTAADNTADMMTKRRGRGQFRPGAAPSAKLTAEQVATIRQRLANGEAMSHVAADHGVHPTTVLAIRDGRTWRTQSIDNTTDSKGETT